MIHTIDLRLTGLPGAVATHVILGPEPALVDPGPTTTLPALRAGLAEHGLAPSDLRHLLLTHVHLDHAGAAGTLARANTSLLVHAHDDALRFLADPTRLVASARRTFGDRHDELWAEMLPVPEGQLRGWSPGNPGESRGSGAGDLPPGIRALETPGHLPHHTSFLWEIEGVLLAGDALGIVLAEGAPPHPPTPPPGIDLAAWRSTLVAIRATGAERAALQHFGVHEGVRELADGLERAIDALEARVRGALAAGDEVAAEERTAFGEETRARQGRHRPPHDVGRYFGIFTAESDWDGVRRYVEKSG